MNLYRWGAMAVLAWACVLLATPALAMPSTLASGDNFSCAVIDGGVQCWGSNSYGQLGNPAFGDSSTAIDVPKLRPGTNAGVTSIAAGSIHVCAVVNGGVQCWGYNGSGRLGDGTTISRAEPVTAIPAGSGVEAISSGANFTCAVADGGLMCWGANDGRQLGKDGVGAYSATPIQTAAPGTGITAIAAGYAHACAVLTGGLTCWGKNSEAELGLGFASPPMVPQLVLPINSAITSVAAGRDFTCVLQVLADGAAAKCWGANSVGQLGNGNNSPVNQASMSTPVINAVDNVESISAKDDHACVIRNGSGWCWGRNTNGELGIGTTTDSKVAVSIANRSPVDLSVGTTHACLRESGSFSIYCWGKLGRGQIGAGSDERFRVPTSAGSAGKSVVGISQAAHHGCMITSDGGVRCWGENSFGQAGNGQISRAIYTSTAVAGINSGATAIATGTYHSCAIVGGSVECWGEIPTASWGIRRKCRAPFPKSRCLPPKECRRSQLVHSIPARSPTTALTAGVGMTASKLGRTLRAA